jgi:hypothetical protein
LAISPQASYLTSLGLIMFICKRNNYSSAYFKGLLRALNKIVQLTFLVPGKHL